jgi:TrmH family RNA methyltransferase
MISLLWLLFPEPGKRLDFLINRIDSQLLYKIHHMMITSTSNPTIQRIKALQSQSRQRREEQAFVVEGVRLVEEALQAGWQAQQLLYSGEPGQRTQGILVGFKAQGCPVVQVSENVMGSASDTQTPQGLLAVLTMKELVSPTELTFALIADSIRDPGNLGTILRTAAAAGAQLVWVPPATVDPYAPKVLRSAMGAHFRLPVQSCTWEQIFSLAQMHHLKMFLAESAYGEVYHRCDFRQPLALIVGGEAEGSSDQARRLAPTPVHIPMMTDTESLNAAVAAGIILFEVARQRQTRNNAAS